MASTLSDAVSEAVKAGETSDTPVENTPKSGTSDEPNTPNTDEVEEDDGLSKLEIVQARQLFSALKDPEQSGSIIDFLASNSGYKRPDEVVTKKDEIAAKKDLAKHLEESLGDDFKWLAPKLGPAIESYINDIRDETNQTIEEKTSKLEEAHQETELRKYREEATHAEKDIAQKYYQDGKVPKTVSDMMIKVMDRFQPTPEMSPTDYMNEVYQIAAMKTGGIPNEITKQQKINSNRNNAPSNLKNGAHPQEGVPVKGKVSLKDAVQQAIDSLTNN
ncbi:MAG: hypothetical protein ACREHG_06845 [Candidatus Saccharimonadales bacterium]